MPATTPTTTPLRAATDDDQLRMVADRTALQVRRSVSDLPGEIVATGGRYDLNLIGSRLEVLTLDPRLALEAAFERHDGVDVVVVEGSSMPAPG